jgi:hypothetical protein
MTTSQRFGDGRKPFGHPLAVRSSSNISSFAVDGRSDLSMVVLPPRCSRTMLIGSVAISSGRLAFDAMIGSARRSTTKGLEADIVHDLKNLGLNTKTPNHAAAPAARPHEPP